MSSRGRHVFDFMITSLTDEGIGVRSPDLLNRAQWLECFSRNIVIYNIAFVNSERWLAKSRVDITLCQHEKFPAILLLKFFVLYYKRNIKHFFRIDIYSYINTRENWKNSKLCENTPPCGRRVSTQFLVFPISTRVDITVYQHGKCFIFLKYQKVVKGFRY